MQRNVFDISWISLWRVFFFLIFASILYFSQQIILGLFLAIVISAGLDFMVDFLERRGIPRSFGVVIIFLSTLLAIVFLLYTVVPFLIADLNTVLSKFNRPVATYWLGPLVNFQPDRSIALFVSRISTQLFSGNFSPISTFSDVLGGLGLAVAVLFSSFYLSLNRDGIERFIRAVLPDAYEDQAIEIYRRSRRKMGVWFQTQLILSFIIGMLVYVALLVLGLQHAFILAFLAGLFELVPFVGPRYSGRFERIFSALVIGVMVGAFLVKPLGQYLVLSGDSLIVYKHLLDWWQYIVTAGLIIGVVDIFVMHTQKKSDKKKS
jgi:predicted PurR-regulated permease PerM